MALTLPLKPNDTKQPAPSEGLTYAASSLTSWGKTLFFFTLCSLLLAFCCGLLLSCSTSDQPQDNLAQKEKIYRNSVLPELNGEYSYLSAELVAKHTEDLTLEVKAAAWDIEGPFRKSTIKPGQTGIIMCSEFNIYPAGIRDGAPIVISYKESEASTFPLIAHTVEVPYEFEERMLLQ